MKEYKLGIPETLRKYNIKEIELCAVLLYFTTGNKSWAWKQTVGTVSKSPNTTVLAQQFYSQDKMKMIMYDFEQRFWNKEPIIIEKIVEKIVEKKVDRIDAPSPPIVIQSPIKQEETKIKIADKYGIIDDINKENIKSIYINELNNSDNPEKRADLILKLSDKLELFAAVEENLAKPTIYLPERPE